MVVVRQRLAHAHDDEVVHEAGFGFWVLRFEWSRCRVGRTRNSQLQTRDSLRGQHLLHDFLRPEVALPSVEAARAELAAVGTAHLRGDAQRVAVAGLAVERGVGGDEHALDERAIGQPPEELLRGVGRALLADEFEDVEREGLGQLRAKRLGQIRHRVPARDAALVEPVQHLPGAVSRRAPLLQAGFQVVTRDGFDVSH